MRGTQVRGRGRGEETKDEEEAQEWGEGEEQEEGDRCDPPQLGCLFGEERRW